jgi:hypothetical protein
VLKHGKERIFRKHIARSMAADKHEWHQPEVGMAPKDRKLRYMNSKTLFLGLLPLLTGCMSVQQGKPLVPSGPLDDGPMVIRKVFQDTPAQSNIQVGDKVIALGNTPVRSIGEYFKLSSGNSYNTVTIEKSDGMRKTLSIDKLLKPNSHQAYASPLNDGETFIVRQSSADGEPRLAGLLSAGDLFGTISGTFWEKSNNVIEIRVTGTVSEKCSKCLLKNVALMDWNARSWIQPISIEDAAWLIYPALDQPGTVVNVPPPVPINATALSTTSGTFDAYRSGDYIYGNYAGHTVTTVVPQYDYTLTNMALMQNLAVSLQRDNIRQQNRHRHDFVSKRSGNLRTGNLNPGEKLMGHVFFAPPKNLTGPYLVFVDGGDSESVGAVRLDIGNNP